MSYLRSILDSIFYLRNKPWIRWSRPKSASCNFHESPWQRLARLSSPQTHNWIAFRSLCKCSVNPCNSSVEACTLYATIALLPVPISSMSNRKLDAYLSTVRNIYSVLHVESIHSTNLMATAGTICSTRVCVHISARWDRIFWSMVSSTLTHCHLILTMIDCTPQFKMDSQISPNLWTWFLLYKPLTSC